ncbi:MAG TPA: hypothetical protein VK771_10045 [Acidimicrobiia bacterium]|nr:hypothetical protein [Acidimicrobiia bacterium]
MHEPPEPTTPAAPTEHTCVECGATIPVTGGTPLEFLVARRGTRSRRVLTVAGSEVHRCASVFLIGTS